jgi:hypothetical protein
VPDAFVLSRSDVEKIRADHRRLKGMVAGERARARRNDRGAGLPGLKRAKLTETLSWKGTAMAQPMKPPPSDEVNAEPEIEVTDGMLNEGDSLAIDTVVAWQWCEGVRMPVSWTCPTEA